MNELTLEPPRRLRATTRGLVLAGYTMGTWWALVGMSLAVIGFYGSKGNFQCCDVPQRHGWWLRNIGGIAKNGPLEP